MRIRYSHLIYMILGGAVFFILAGVGLTGVQEKKLQSDIQLQRAQGNVLVLEDQITQTFQLVENMVSALTEVDDTALLNANPAELNRMLLRLQHSLPALRSLSIMKPKKGIYSSSNLNNIGIQVSLDEFFPIDEGIGDKSVLQVGKIWTGRDFADGKIKISSKNNNVVTSQFLPLVFRTGHGGNSVWILAAINPDYLLSRMDRYLLDKNDWFELVRFDGEFLMNSHEKDTETRSILSTLLTEIQQREIGTHVGRWLTAYRSSSRYPLVMAVHIDSEMVLSRWLIQFGKMVFWTIVAMCALLAVSVALMRQVHLNERRDRAQQQELTLSRDRAEAATVAKSRFLATMSHEIRTPMNGVIGMTQLALEEPLTNLADRYVRSAHGAAQSLLRILDDILDLSKIEAGKLEIEIVQFDFNELLQNLITMQRLMADDRALSLTMEISPSIPKWIQADPLRISQILNNLLSNAIKFTPSGNVTLKIYEATKNILHIEVKDQGIGISKDNIEKLFQPFHQADNSTSRLYGGTGLGLAICRQLCLQMGGRISVKSQIGIGSTFSVDLPFESVDVTAKDNNASGVMTSQPGLKRDFAGLRVMIVEDQVRNRQLLEALLKKVKIDVTVATQGEEALHLLENTPNLFDLILMDIQMPVMSGLTATERIRSDPKYDNLPIIAVTANAMIEERNRCMEVGMQDYITKPLNSAKLYECIAKWIT